MQSQRAEERLLGRMPEDAGDQKEGGGGDSWERFEGGGCISSLVRGKKGKH